MFKGLLLMNVCPCFNQHYKVSISEKTFKLLVLIMFVKFEIDLLCFCSEEYYLTHSTHAIGLGAYTSQIY